MNRKDFEREYLQQPVPGKTIVLDDGKYIIELSPEGTFKRILRHGKGWPAGDELGFAKVFLSLVHAFLELRDRNADEEKPRDDGTVRKAHYGSGRQPWDDIVETGWGAEFAAGNVLKYLRRAKDPGHSLAAARWYWARLTEMCAAPCGINARGVRSDLTELLTVEEKERLT